MGLSTIFHAEPPGGEHTPAYLTPTPSKNFNITSRSFVTGLVGAKESQITCLFRPIINVMLSSRCTAPPLPYWLNRARIHKGNTIVTNLLQRNIVCPIASIESMRIFVSAITIKLRTK